MLEDVCRWQTLLLGVQGSEQEAGVGGGAAIAPALTLPATMALPTVMITVLSQNCGLLLLLVLLRLCVSDLSWYGAAKLRRQQAQTLGGSRRKIDVPGFEEECSLAP